MNEISAAQNLLAQLRATAAAAQGSAVSSANATSGAAQGADFSALLKKSVDTVNGLQKQSGALSTAFEMGDSSVSLAEVMIARKKADISFQSIMQVRNKLVQAYKDIMSMPV
jgi:flagellar hook-basal body complex protein FliE